MHAEQVETGAWTGQAFIQYDVNEVTAHVLPAHFKMPDANKTASRVAATRAVLLTASTMDAGN